MNVFSGIGDGSMFTFIEVGGFTGRKDLWTREKIGFERYFQTINFSFCISKFIKFTLYPPHKKI